MAWFYFLLLLITDVCGLILAAFTLPGLWLMLAGAAVYAWLTHGYYLSWKTLIALLLLATGAEIAELFLGGAGAKKAGATGWGVAGGLIGGLVGGICLTGLIPIPILGTIIGICLGCFIGAFAVELLMGQPLTQSARIGYGAAKGKLTGIAGKILFGLLMMLITFVCALPIHGSQPKPAIVLPTTSSSTSTPAVSHVPTPNAPGANPPGSNSPGSNSPGLNPPIVNSRSDVPATAPALIPGSR